MRHLAFLVVCACGGDSTQTPPMDAPAEPDMATPKHFIAYVSGNGPDIAWYAIADDGGLTAIDKVATFAANPSFMAITDGNLYAVSESNSRVGAYARDRATGALTFINDASAGGTGPAHVSVDRSGKWVFTANYGSGAIAVLPIQGNGGVGAPSQMINAGMNAHMIVSDAGGRHVFVPCLGSNYVAQYDFDPTTGMLTANAVPKLMTATGAGPRHLAFAPDGAHAFLINESNSTLTALSYNASLGQLTEINTISTRPTNAAGTNTTAEVWVHPNGKFVYGSNRGDDTIAVFSVGGNGAVTLVGQTSTQGMTPRMFALDPLGRYLYAGNQNSDTVVPFAIDATSGALSPIAAPITARRPEFIGVVARD